MTVAAPTPEGPLATDRLFERVALVGIGHIGSSVARALREEPGLIGTLVATDADAASLARAAELGIVDDAITDLADAVKGADLVVLCTPVRTYRALAETMAPALAPSVIVTDVGSVKSSVVRQVTPSLPDHATLIPGHPIAGTEHSGPDSGFAELFEGRYWLLTPAEDAPEAAVARLSALWTRVGAIVEILTPEYHDKVLALTSHLPHLIAYTIVGTAVDLEGHLKGDVIRYSAGGFRDFTRIAGSNPIMWRDVFLENREAVLEMVQRFTEDLNYLQRAIRWGEGDKLQELFTRTRAIRRGVIDAKQDEPPKPKEDGQD